MSSVCNGEGCLRKETCERYIDGLYFNQGRPFAAATLCEWVGTEYLDYYVPVEHIDVIEAS